MYSSPAGYSTCSSCIYVAVVEISVSTDEPVLSCTDYPTSYFRNVRLYINEKTLRLARRHVNQSKSSFACFFVGSVSVDSSEYKI